MDFVVKNHQKQRTFVRLEVPEFLVDEIRPYCTQRVLQCGALRQDDMSAHLKSVFSVADFAVEMEPVISFLRKNFNDTFVPAALFNRAIGTGVFDGDRYWVFEHLCSCISDEDLTWLILDSKLRIGCTLVHHSLDRGLPLPSTVNNRPLLNWYIESGGELPRVHQIVLRYGFAIQYPLVCLRPECCRVFTINLDVLKWVLDTNPSVYPLSHTPDDIPYQNLDNSPKDSTCLLALLVTSGYVPSSVNLSACLQWLHFDPTRFVPEQRAMMKRIQVGFQSGTFFFELGTWSPFTLGPPNDTSFKFILTCVPTQYLWRVVQFLVRNNQCFCLNMNYWSLELHHRGHLYAVSKYYLSVLGVDPRILSFIFPSVTRHYTDSPKGVDHVFRKPEWHLKFDGTMVACHLPPLLKASSFLRVLVENRGFKRLQGMDDGIIELQEGLPENMEQPEATVKRWIFYCYTGLIPTTLCVEDVVELQSLAVYLLDSGCLRAVDAWLENAFVRDFRVHGDDHHRREACLVCCAWNKCSAEPFEPVEVPECFRDLL